jgi:hypothetical protein
LGWLSRVDMRCTLTTWGGGGGAGPIYTREEGKGEGKKYGEGGISFAQSRRFYREELGPSHKGPFISNVGSP